MTEDSSNFFRKMSLRRALWRARMAGKALRDQAQLAPAERHATDLLRASVKQQLRHEPLDGFVSGVYGVEDRWRAEVLRRDPSVLYARTLAELTAALNDPTTRDVLAPRDLQLELDDLPHPPAGKNVFVEF